MPLYGSDRINSNDTIEMFLPTNARGYMMRIPSWHGVDLTGWSKIANGPYVKMCGQVIYDMEMYTKLFQAGTYIMDDKTAFYLFDMGKSYQIDNFKCISRK